MSRVVLLNHNQEVLFGSIGFHNQRMELLAGSIGFLNQRLELLAGTFGIPMIDYIMKSSFKSRNSRST